MMKHSLQPKPHTRLLFYVTTQALHFFNVTFSFQAGSAQSTSIMTHLPPFHPMPPLHTLQPTPLIIRPSGQLGSGQPQTVLKNKASGLLIKRTEF